jgi:hypothetical protein
MENYWGIIKGLLVTAVLAVMIFLVTQIGFFADTADFFLGGIDSLGHSVFSRIKGSTVIDNQRDCLLAQGEWKVSSFGKESCSVKIDDAGKSCLSGFQCQSGVCLTESFTNQKAGSGKCQSTVLHETRGLECSKKIHLGLSLPNVVCLE